MTSERREPVPEPPVAGDASVEELARHQGVQPVTSVEDLAQPALFGWDEFPTDLDTSRRAVVDARADWSGVRDRVIAVVDYPPFQSVLTADEIAGVEAQYGVTLPGEYRSFLAEVGAGGPGPGLSLTWLRQVDGKWVWAQYGYYDVLDPSGPFTESKDWADQQVKTLRAAGYEPGVRDETYDYRESYRQVFGGGVEGDDEWVLERYRGVIAMSDHGCGMSSWLIVVGPHRGELRFRDCAVNPPFEPEVDAHGNRHTFYTWYIEWLEQREAEHALQRRRPRPDPGAGSGCR